MQHLFLQQSYLDCYESYSKSLLSESVPRWDYVVLTASNESQAQVYRAQITYRQKQGRLPGGTEFVVLPDPQGKRVGSGGATLNVLKHIAQRERDGKQEQGKLFAGKRILVIHSGGDSKRVPQYSACGKLFSPVPRSLPDGSPSTLFDEFMISMAGVAGRLKEGMLTLSGDVLLLFNPLQIDFSFAGAAALSMKKHVSVGKNHGVFLSDGRDCVERFLHKQSEEQLGRLGAVDQRGMVHLDTGAIAMDTGLMRALYGLICEDGKYSEKKFLKFVNEKARISFYGDFLYPLASNAVYEEYLQETSEGEFCEELLDCRRQIWEVLRNFRLRLISLSPAEFIHFGTTGELLRLMTHEVEDYSFLGWKKQVQTNLPGGAAAAYNSLVSPKARIEEKVYLENCRVGAGVKIGRGSIVSGLELQAPAAGELELPEGAVLHGLFLKDGSFVVRIYDVKWNPKESCEKWIHRDLCQEVGPETSLWEGALYPACRDMGSAVEAALCTWRLMHGLGTSEEKDWWLKQERISLKESFAREDSERFWQWVRDLEEEIRVTCFVDALAADTPWETAMESFGRRGISPHQRELLEELAQGADFFKKIRVYYALMQYDKRQGLSGEKYGTLCFGEIRNAVYQGTADILGACRPERFAREQVHVELPLRVNWGGGWTDTPPHCMERGAAVLNAAIKLNGIYPVQVTVRRLEEYKVVVASEDVGAYGELLTTEEILDCSNPYDAFALHKAALVACGLIPPQGGRLEEILEKLGGGIYLSTQVIGVPKGSGLGTSSILAGACVKALFELMGMDISLEKIYDMVLGMEQLMSTGGGWQDQVGGLSGGVKFCTSHPGIPQKIKVTEVEVSSRTMEELTQRFALIYTGQRRLARNLLREVVGNYIGGRPQSREVLFRVQRLAALMRFELEKGNIDEFAKLLNEHWELSKQLDAGSTNTCIEQIFAACEDLIDGRFIAGAGGGGFLQVILKKGVTKDKLQRRLEEVFQDSGVAVWDCEFC